MLKCADEFYGPFRAVFSRVAFAGSVAATGQAAAAATASSKRREQCDDGNSVTGDGCEADCTMTPSTGGTAARR